MGLAVAYGRSRAERLLGLAAAFAFIAYLFTPRSGGGIESFPTYFPSNLRYVAVPVALGLALLPLAPPVSRLMSRAAAPLLPAGAMAAVLVLGGRDEHPAVQLGIVAATLAAAALFAAGVSRRLPKRPALAVSLGIALIVAVTVGAWRGERSYLADRYTDSPLSLARQLPDEARVAVVGGGGTYQLFGPSLNRTVERIGSRGSRRFLPAIGELPGMARRASSGRLPVPLSDSPARHSQQGRIYPRQRLRIHHAGARVDPWGRRGRGTFRGRERRGRALQSRQAAPRVRLSASRRPTVGGNALEWETGASGQPSTIRPWIVAAPRGQTYSGQTRTPAAAVTGGHPTRSNRRTFGPAFARAYSLARFHLGG